MHKSEFIPQLNAHRITDGLLRDFISRELYIAAKHEIGPAIKKRKTEIAFLEQLNIAITKEIAIEEKGEK